MILVDFYQTAAGREVIKEFLNGLPDKELAKVLHEIELLELYGTELQGPHTKHIDGPIWELRTKFSSNIHRIFYFVWNDNKIILLHGFTKKTQKTPASEVRAAKRNWKDYIARYGDDRNNRI